MDGVSVTQGSSPRKHVWTFLADYSESVCPCSTGSTESVRSFMGNDYFCESGNPNNVASHILYTSDPLWDGQSCRNLESPCCNVPGIHGFTETMVTLPLLTILS